MNGMLLEMFLNRNLLAGLPVLTLQRKVPLLEVYLDLKPLIEL